MDNSLRPFLKRKVFVLKETAMAAEAARVMAEHNVGCVIVSDGLGHICGLVTDRDLTCEVLAHEEHSSILLQDIMTKSLLAVESTDELNDVLSIMKKSGVRRVPILKIEKTGRHKCVGLVTLDDLLVRKMINESDLAKIVRHQVRVPHYRKSKSELRRRSRQEQTLNTFYKVLAREMGVSRPSAVAVGNFLLTQVIQRVPHVEALHLISELPKLLHDELLALPEGPNRKITPRQILQTLDEEFGFNTKTAFRLVRGFWNGLEYFFMGHETEHLLNQMSKELQVFFAGEPYHKQPPQAITHRDTISTVH